MPPYHLGLEYLPYYQLPSLVATFSIFEPIMGNTFSTKTLLIHTYHMANHYKQVILLRHTIC